MYKKFCLTTLLTIICLSFVTNPVNAENKPVQISLFNPVQIFPENSTIGGVRVNLIYGKNTSVSGIDFGLVNHTTSGLTKGWQFGGVGYNEGDFLGFQNNVVNYTKGNCEGLALGFVNYAGHANGVQIGFVNYAESMKGLQIGLINIIKKGGQFPVFPIVNWSF